MSRTILIYHSFTVIMLPLLTNADILNPPLCDIFCRGKILEVVQNSNIYPDCKTFVDMTMKLPANQTQALFDKMMKVFNGKPPKVYIRRFVRHCFSAPGKELGRQQPTDWVPNPNILMRIMDRHLRDWAKHLIYLWKRLGRRVSTKVRDHPEKYTLVYVPNLIVIPGGRYREFYYWDTYWIILGLLHSEMYETVKGILTNFLILTETYGYIPKGGRIYYLTSSNLPLLIPMVKEYYKTTKNKAFINKNIGTLEKEFNFWINNRTIEVSVGGETLKVARYNVEADEPRPEAYREDITAAIGIKSQKDKRKLFRNLIACSESGWDYSSRWFISDGNNEAALTYTHITSIAPVDLNAVLCWNARILAEFYTMLDMPDKASTYDGIASEFQKIVTDLMWNEEDGIWYDYDILSQKNRKYFYASNVFPLWTGCYDMNRSDHIGSKVTRYLKSLKLDHYNGGIPTSLNDTGLHWDFPNAIPPMQHLIITGLRRTENKDAVDLAFRLARKWILSTYEGYLFSKVMYDNYNAQESGLQGGDLFLVAQVGFGWTNGVCLDLLNSYGKQIFTRSDDSAISHFGPPVILHVSIGVLIIIL